MIRRSDKNILNGKSEWHQPALFRVQQEIEQGKDVAPVCVPGWGNRICKFFILVLKLCYNVNSYVVILSEVIRAGAKTSLHKPCK